VEQKEKTEKGKEKTSKKQEQRKKKKNSEKRQKFLTKICIKCSTWNILAKEKVKKGQ
jgi:hypothetical protein